MERPFRIEVLRNRQKGYWRCLSTTTNFDKAEEMCQTVAGGEWGSTRAFRILNKKTRETWLYEHATRRLTPGSILPTGDESTLL